MTVRRLKKKQIGPKCSFCNDRATHRGCGFTVFSCDADLPELKRRDDLQEQYDSRETEAEFSLCHV